MTRVSPDKFSTWSLLWDRGEVEKPRVFIYSPREPYVKDPIGVFRARRLRNPRRVVLKRMWTTSRDENLHH